MSARFRSLRAAAIRRIKNLPGHKQAAAWQEFNELPPNHFDSPGSQAIHRERREAAKRAAVKPAASNEVQS